MVLVYQVLDKNFRTTDITYDLFIDYDDHVFSIDVTINMHVVQNVFRYTFQSENPADFAQQLYDVKKDNLVHCGLANEITGVVDELVKIIEREINKFLQKKKAICTVTPLKAYL